MTDASLTAEKLLQVSAVQLSPASPFAWASGWKSPIYCDNRKILSHPYVRDFFKSELCNVVFEHFPAAEAVAGVATAGIPWGAMVADQLKLPFVYVRPKPKEHGLGNQVEGSLLPHQKVVVLEDLISTGKSSFQVVQVLRSLGVQVAGIVSIFNYGFPEAGQLFESEGIKVLSLTDYPTLLTTASRQGVITSQQEALLLKWSADPSKWQPVP
ncbi:MAG TPA: orotate phosphoribosyltransferase [Flavisolibacter sp.]